MPGPTTEVLNEDVRELKADVKEVRTELVGLAHTTGVLNGDVRELKSDVKEVKAELVSLAHTAGVLNGDVGELKADVKEVKAELKSDMKEVKAELSRLAIAQAEMRAEIRITLGLARWGAGLVIATALGSGISGVWWASGISAEVKHLADVVAASRPQAPLAPQPAPPQPEPAPKAE